PCGGCLGRRHRARLLAGGAPDPGRLDDLPAPPPRAGSGALLALVAGVLEAGRGACLDGVAAGPAAPGAAGAGPDGDSPFRRRGGGWGVSLGEPRPRYRRRRAGSAGADRGGSAPAAPAGSALPGRLARGGGGPPRRDRSPTGPRGALAARRQDPTRCLAP